MRSKIINLLFFSNTIDLFIINCKQFLRPLVPHLSVLFLLLCERLSTKPKLFKSFTGLTVQEFDDIYKKEIAKRYKKHEINGYPNEKTEKEA